MKKAASRGFMFCFGRARQIHEVEAVESPRAETEPVVVFLILFCSYSHSLTILQAFCTRTRLQGSRESDTQRDIVHTHTHTYAEPIHSYFFQNIPNQILLCLCQRFVPHSANSKSQQNPKFDLEHSLYSNTVMKQFLWSTCLKWQ